MKGRARLLRAADVKRAQWRKSTRCDANSCVEVALLPDAVAIRNSADPGGPVLSFHRESWQAFLWCIRSGELTGPGRPTPA
ncbi:MAG: DUF397 domain-containing protein [Micromonosporaceae bacterium]|nr:DUF397 domain-containing protein [Micromonosporaceae bacterium]